MIHRRAERTIPALDPAEWLAFIRDRFGLDLETRHWEMCEPAIRRAMDSARIPDARQFRATVERDDAAFELLVNELTVGETYFFRDPRQLEFLRQRAIPERLRERTDWRPFTIWSAGCASGEEPYSLAMLFEEMGLAAPQIVGTDLSRARLAIARRGSYGKWSLRGVDDSLVRRYFEAGDGRYRVAERMRQVVKFRQLNLLTDLPHDAPVRNADLVVCRNVLIYLEPEAVQRVMRHLVDSLAMGGWLLLGPSDPPLTDIADRAGCEVVLTEAGLAYRRTSPQSARPSAPAATSSPAPHTAIGSGGGSVRGTPPHAPRAEVTGARRDAPSRTRDHRAASATPPAPTGAAATSAGVPAAISLDTLLADVLERHRCRADEEAAALAERYLTAGGADPVAGVVLVRALANLGHERQALHACDESLRRHPDHAELLVLRALLLTRLRRYPQAVQAARGALYLDRTLAVASLALGVAEARQGNAVAARRAFLNALLALADADDAREVAAAGGESASRLAAVARSELQLLGEPR